MHNGIVEPGSVVCSVLVAITRQKNNLFLHVTVQSTYYTWIVASEPIWCFCISRENKSHSSYSEGGSVGLHMQ